MDVFHQDTWVPVVLVHVYHILNLGSNFFSVKAATSKDLRVLFESTQFLVLRRQEVRFSGRLQEKLFVLDSRLAQDRAQPFELVAALDLNNQGDVGLFGDLGE